MNLLQKKEWTKDEYYLFINNVKWLAENNSLTIGELQEKIGRKNIFRKDILRPSDKLITIISEIFNVSRKWLVEFHPPDSRKINENKEENSKDNLRRLSDKLNNGKDSREGILELFDDRQSAREMIIALAKIEKTSPKFFYNLEGRIQTIMTMVDNSEEPAIDEPTGLLADGAIGSGLKKT